MAQQEGFTIAIISQNPQIKEICDQFDADREKSLSVIEGLRKQAEDEAKRWTSQRDEYFARIESAIIEQGIAPEGYDPKTWNLNFSNGAIAVFPPSEKESKAKEELKSMLAELLD